MPVHAVALAGCGAAAEAPLAGVALEVVAPSTMGAGGATVRAFHGMAGQIVDDGSDGDAAHLRVTGVDDVDPRAELAMAARQQGAVGGSPTPRPLDLEMVADYRLAPSGRTLEIALSARPTAAGPGAIWGVAALQPAADAQVSLAPEVEPPPGGWPVHAGVPWVLARSDAATALLARPALAGSAIPVAGWTALMATAPRTLASEATLTETFLLAVGEADAAAAAADLGRSASRRQVAGADSKKLAVRSLRLQARAAATGGVPAGVAVALERRARGGGWHALSVATTDATGGATLWAPAGVAGPFRVASAGGGPWQAATGPTLTALPAEGGSLPALRLGHQLLGEVAVEVRGDDGRPLPARVALFSGDREVAVAHGAGSSVVAVGPGRYTAVVSRGMTYAPFEADVIVAPGRRTEVTARLTRAVDPGGMRQVAMQVAAAPAAGCQQGAAERLQQAAASGIDILVSANPDAVADWSGAAATSGVGAWVAVVPGTVVPGAGPDGAVAFPVLPEAGRPDGGPVNWQGLDMPHALAATRERGAGVVILAGARAEQSCRGMCRLNYDRVAGAFRPQAAPGAPPPWSWDFDGVAIMHGDASLLAQAAAPERSGALDDWMSFLNHGHPVAAVAGGVGCDARMDAMPATFVAAATSAQALRPEALADAIRAGRTTLSAGALAELTVDGTAAGDLAAPRGGEVSVRLRVQGLPGVDVAQIKVMANCDEVASVAATSPGGAVKFDGVIPVRLSRDAHIVAMGFGRQPMPRGLPQFDAATVPRFVSSAVLVDVDGNGRFDAPGGKSCQYGRPSDVTLSEEDVPVGPADAMPD